MARKYTTPETCQTAIDSINEHLQAIINCASSIQFDPHLEAQFSHIPFHNIIDLAKDIQHQVTDAQNELDYYVEQLPKPSEKGEHPIQGGKPVVTLRELLLPYFWFGTERVFGWSDCIEMLVSFLELYRDSWDCTDILRVTQAIEPEQYLSVEVSRMIAGNSHKPLFLVEHTMFRTSSVGFTICPEYDTQEKYLEHIRPIYTKTHEWVKSWLSAHGWLKDIKEGN